MSDRDRTAHVVAMSSESRRRAEMREQQERDSMTESVKRKEVEARTMSERPSDAH